MWNLAGSTVTREHIEDLLPIMRLTEAQRRRVLALPYPVPAEVVAEVLGTMGIDTGELTDRAGGSP
jgi:hypothetical protein